VKTTTIKLDQIAADYHANDAIPDIHIENLCQEYFIRWLLGQIPKDARILELGYGDGLVTAALVNAGCRLTLVEGAATLVSSAMAALPGIECIHSLFEDFRTPARFDVILASHVLEHVDEPQAILRLMSSWLAADGKIIIVVPNRNSLHRQLAVIMGLQRELDTLSARDELVGHQRVYSLEVLNRDIVQSGLEIVDSTGLFLKVLPNSMMLDYSRELLWALNEISAALPKELLANIVVTATKCAKT
jgi:2-polyprenyl-3-methyl-5-hydroxy-6-metoxy-1,4-benzoquinol methylase